MKRKDFLEYLEDIMACSEASEYVKKSKQSLSTLYNRTKYGDYLVWLGDKSDFAFSKKARKKFETLAVKINGICFADDWRYDLAYTLSLSSSERAKIANVFRQVVSKKKFFAHLENKMQIKGWHLNSMIKMGLELTSFFGDKPSWSWLIQDGFKNYSFCNSDRSPFWNPPKDGEPGSNDATNREIYKKILEGQVKPDYKGSLENLPEAPGKTLYRLVDKGTHYVTEER